MAEKRALMESPPGPTEKGTESKKMKTDPPRILYVLAPYCFSAIHLNEQEQLNEQEEKSVDTGGWPPTPISVAEVHLGTSLPIEMGIFKHKSDIFVFGSYRFITSTNLYPDVLPKPDVMEINGYSIYGDPIPKSKNYEIKPDDFFPNLDVIKFNRPCGAFTRAENIPKMKGFKRRPTVAQVGHKIFVHSFCCSHMLAQRPVFECYNTDTGEWKVLPDWQLPQSSEDFLWYDGLIDHDSFVVCNKIYFYMCCSVDMDCLVDEPFVNAETLHCFDTDSETWDQTSAVTLVNSFLEAGLRLPHHTRSFLGLKSHSQNLSLIVYSPYEKAETLSFGLIEKSGCLRLHEELKLKVPLFGGYSLQVLHVNKECIVDLEDGCHMCLIISTYVKAPPQNPASHAYYICIFEVKILLDDDLLLNACNGSPLQSKKFIDAQVKEQYWYKMPQWSSTSSPIGAIIS